MNFTTVTKSIIQKNYLNLYKNKSVYSIQGTQNTARYKYKRPNRQLKQYEKLIFSPPIMNINIDMIMTINELRPKATYIIATKNGRTPNLIASSTFNIVQCLNYIQGHKFYYKSIPSLVQNIVKVIKQNVSFNATGMYKSNAIKKIVSIATSVDSIYGEKFVQTLSMFIIWSLESSIKIKKQVQKTLKPLKQKLQNIQSQLNILNKSENKQQTLINLLTQDILQIKKQIKDISYNNKFMKEQDFLCGLHYCLQKGYYSQTILRYFFQQINQKNNYQIKPFSEFLNEQKQFYFEKSLNNVQNRKAIIYSRIYNNIIYRIKIFNELKNMKKTNPTFADFLNKKDTNQKQDTSQSTSEQSPFISGQKKEYDSSTSQSTQQKVFMTQSLIEQYLIPKDKYMKLIKNLFELLDKKDILLFILTEQGTSQSLRILPTQFYLYKNQQESNNKFNDIMSPIFIKKVYMKLFKQIYNIQKNGTLYAESSNTAVVFQIILKMFDYSDSKQVFQLLQYYQNYLFIRNTQQVKTLAPFYVCQKYNYKSNNLASKYLQLINIKPKSNRQQYLAKQQMILQSNQICKNISLYFKLLQDQISTLTSNTQTNNLIRNKNTIQIETNLQNEIYNSKSNFRRNKKYQQQFQQAVQVFLHNFHKIISVLYIQTKNQNFIAQGSEMYYYYLKAKYFNIKSYQNNLLVDGIAPQEDVMKILKQNNQLIESKKQNLIRFYEKQYLLQNKGKDQNFNGRSNFNPYKISNFIKKGFYVNPLDQLIVTLDIAQTAIQLQTAKNVQYFQDVLVIFKSIFQNKKLVKIIQNNINYPDLLKKLVKISQIFKGSYKNQSNKLFQSILNLTDFNLNNFLHDSRINVARQILNAQRPKFIQQKFQPYLHCLELNSKYDKNFKLWHDSGYLSNKKNVLVNVRSDILYTALMQNIQLQKIIRDQLAKIKTVKPSQKIKYMKFQINYLEYPYLANVAINKNNQLIVILIRKPINQQEQIYNQALINYYNQCQSYFKKKGNTVIVVTQQHQIRSSLKNIVK